MKIDKRFCKISFEIFLMCVMAALPLYSQETSESETPATESESTSESDSNQGDSGGFSGAGVAKPTQVQLVAGSVGIGVGVGYFFNSQLYGGWDFRVASAARTTSSGSYDYEATANFATHIFLARYSIWQDNPFYLQGGLAYRDWDTRATSFERGTNTKVATLEVEFPAIAFNYGVGWNWIADSGFSGGLGLSLLSGGPPTVKIKENRRVLSDAAIKDQENDAEEIFSAFANVPLLTFNTGWNF